MKMKTKSCLMLLIMTFTMLGCGEECPTCPVAPSPSPLQVRGYVSSTSFVITLPAIPNQRGAQGDLHYTIAIESNATCYGCWISVEWIDEEGDALGYAYAGTALSIPTGQSEVSNLDYMRQDMAEKIRNSVVTIKACHR